MKAPTPKATTTAVKKTYKLDLFGQTLPALYKCDFNFYANRTAEERKEIAPLILMRWVSLADGKQDIAPLLVNDFVNVGFWGMSKHPELQWKLLCVAASETSTRTPRHTWVGTKRTKSKTPQLDNYLRKLYPFINEMEMGVLRGKFEGPEGVKEMLLDFGCGDSEIKEIVKEFKSVYGSKKD